VLGGSLRVAAASQIDGSLKLSGGEFIAAAATTLRGTAQWTAGTLSGGGGFTVAAGGHLTLSGNADKTLVTNLRVAPSGTVAQSGSGRLLIDDTVDIINEGLYDIQGTSGGSGTILRPDFTNRGTLRKSVDPGEVKLGGILQLHNEAGVIDAVAGRLVLDVPGRNTGATINVAAGAVVEIIGHVQRATSNQPSSYFSGTYNGSGAGRVELSGGTFSPLDSAQTPVTLNFAPGLFHWTGGTLAATNAGTITLSGSNVKTIGTVGQDLRNTGTILHTGSGALEGVDDFNGTVSNQESGVYDLQSDAAINASVQNFGLFRKSGGSSVATVSRRFGNTLGTVEVSSGTLRFSTNITAPVTRGSISQTPM
jgi:hypothetical protein